MINNVNFEEEGDRFIELFKEFEDTIKLECEKYGIKTERENIGSLIFKVSEKNNVVKRHKKDLDLIRDVRNLNTHKSADKYKYAVFPSPEINTMLEKIIYSCANF